MSFMRDRRPTVLTFVRYYLPGYKSGGPVRTIANLVEVLGGEFDFRIVTSDRDATETEPYPGIGPGWNDVGKAKVLYLAPNRRGLRAVARILRATPHDTLYLNSLLDPDFSLKPLLAQKLGLAPRTRCVIAPRGECADAALQLKAVKKRLFLFAASLCRLHRGVVWQASAPHEETDLRRVLGNGITTRIAPNLPAMPAAAMPEPGRADGDALRICFLSRVSPMKNLTFALEVLRGVGIPVRFDIYGPVRDASYWRRCSALLQELPRDVEAQYRGSVEHAQVAAVLAQYDLFFLPTLGENFGHVIFEALSAGTPVLISDRTPWRGLEAAGAGWDLPLDRPDLFRDRIRALAGLDPDARAAMRRSAFAHARRTGASDEPIRQNRILLAGDDAGASRMQAAAGARDPTGWTD